MLSGASRWAIIAKGLFGLCLSAAAVWLEAAPQQSRAAPAPSLVLISIDTLRADHLSSWSTSSPSSTPAIDRLASHGVAFVRTSTTNPLTLPAHASLMTGQWPPAHGVRDFTGYRLRDDALTLAETLQAQGYRTAAFVSAAVLDSQTGMGQGFEVYDDGFESFLGGDSRVAERPGAQTLALAKRWLRGIDRSKPFFLWVHLFEPHDPYTPPEPYRSRYPRSAYAGEVAYADALVGQLLDELRVRQLYDSSLISLLSDHGEGLGEHGESKHGFFVYESTMHVPWIVKFPHNRFAGQRVEEPVSLVDAFPTLLHGLGMNRRHWPAGLQGESRYRAASGDGQPSTALLYMESLTPRNQFGWSDLRAILRGRWKLIEAPNPELYDLQSDPSESRNLFGDQAALGKSLQEALAGFEARFQEDPQAPSPVDPQLQEQLRSIGYVGSPSAPLRFESRQGLADPKTMIRTYEHMQAGVEAARQKKWDEAIRQLEAAAGSAPQAPAILSSLALTCRDAGRPSQALNWFQKSLQVNPEDIYMRLQLARYLLALGQPDQACLQFESILELDPRNFLALHNLGIHSARSSDFAKSVEYFSKALKVKPDSETSRLLGLAWLNLGQLDEAEQAWLKALEIDPGNRRVHEHLAELYVRLGQPEKAARHRAKAKQD